MPPKMKNFLSPKTPLTNPKVRTCNSKRKREDSKEYLSERPNITVKKIVSDRERNKYIVQYDNSKGSHKVLEM